MRSTKQKINDNDLLRFLKQKYANYPTADRRDIISNIMKLWVEFKPLADSGFYNEFTSSKSEKHQERYWEMYISDHLRTQGHKVSRKTSGPDFQFQLNDNKVWVEAVAAEQGDGNITDYYGQERLRGSNCFQPDIFALRWTQSIRNKIDKFNKYLEKRLVGKDDICIIALNVGLLGSSGMTGKSSYPALVDVLFGTGARYVRIDRDSMAVIETGYEPEPTISKQTPAGPVPVSKRFFLETETQHIDAILASSVTPDHPAPMIAVYNPLARDRLPIGALGAVWEYRVRDADDHWVLETIRNTPKVAPNPY